jgi:hypothetical protein
MSVQFRSLGGAVGTRQVRRTNAASVIGVTAFVCDRLAIGAEPVW